MDINNIKENVKKVNDYWLKKNSAVGDCAWERACYYTGLLDAYRVTGEKRYLDFAKKWASKNEWKFYNDPNYNTENADSILCGEAYLDLLDEFGADGTDGEMKKTLDNLCRDEKNDYWWWVDTIYMALNILNRFGVRENDLKYCDKAYRLYTNTKTERKCFDEKFNLWYRDERFLPDKARNKDGKEIFWSRGNGWVFAGLAKTLDTLDEGNPYYSEYKQMFLKMAKEILSLQLDSGFWHTDLLSPEIFDMPEVSGTVLFTLGFLIGHRLGLLGEEYLKAAVRGYEAITSEAIDDDGKIGWVQIVAWDPGPVDKNGTNDYAVGAYSKVCRELVRIFG